MLFGHETVGACIIFSIYQKEKCNIILVHLHGNKIDKN